MPKTAEIWGKRSVDFTKERTASLKKIIALLGYNGLYGEVPKALDFCVEFTLAMLEKYENSTPDLDREKLDTFFQTVARIKQQKYQAQRIQKTAGIVEKVTPLKIPQPIKCNPQP